MFCYENDDDTVEEEDDTPDYPVNLFMTRSGYFKKITPQSLRMASDQKLKDGDIMDFSAESTNGQACLPRV